MESPRKRITGRVGGEAAAEERVGTLAAARRRSETRSGVLRVCRRR
jgi:hypothetical protein